MLKTFALLLIIIFIGLPLPSLARGIPLDELIPKYTDSKSQFIKIDGVPFHVNQQGHGEPIVLIHGILSSLHTWDQWTKVLAKKYRVIRLDLPGHGLTGPDSSGVYSIERMTALLDKLLKRLNVYSSNIIGNSLGGWIAWEFAARFPTRVKRLVLIDSAGHNVEDVPWVVMLARLPLAQYVLNDNIPRWAVRSFVESVYGNPSNLTEDVLTRYHDLFRREGNANAFFQLTKAPVENHSQLLKKLKMPVLILWGEKDRWINPKYARNFASDIPDARLNTFPELGHVPMEESPRKTLIPVMKFLFNH